MPVRSLEASTPWVAMAWAGVALLGCGTTVPTTANSDPGTDSGSAPSLDASTQAATGAEAGRGSDAETDSGVGEDAGVDAGESADATDARASICSQSCGEIVCSPGSVCVSVEGGASSCVPVPAACAADPGCGCLAAALCPSGFAVACYDQSDLASSSPACLSGVTCASARCTHPDPHADAGDSGAAGPLCGASPCPPGSVCVTASGGTPDSGAPPACRPIPAACAGNPTCACLGPTLCLGDNASFGCFVDPDGCSHEIGCGNL